MPPSLAREIAALGRLTVPELRAQFAAVFGEPTQAHNKVWLVKRLAWRLQALAEGDLSQRGRHRASELVHDADLRLSPPRADQTPVDAAPPQAATLRIPRPVGLVPNRRAATPLAGRAGDWAAAPARRAGSATARRPSADRFG